ncbi:hypothetical protein FBUS_03487 [Fasciolopsis buskii]|uniref:Uncharacterized protein n=1 Tax=Fasciolopsis buskii TaxID=27845 RepID=A0A8E0VM01_9TREM|nr:hypothetical protein FBUS_03487 [Fasciolopsis buski]
MGEYRTFQFSYRVNDSTLIDFKQDLIFPMKFSLDECFHQLVAIHRIPPFAHAALRNSLEQFVDSENEKDFNSRFSIMWSALRSGTRDLSRLCEQLDTAYQTHVSSYANPPRITDEEVFGQAYNRVIHSTAAQQLIQLEHVFAQAVASEVNKRNSVLHQLQEDLVAETERGLQMRDADIPTAITQLQEEHIRNRELIETQWNSCISELRHRQRRQFRELVMNLDERLSLAETNTTGAEKEKQSIEDSLSAILSVATLNSLQDGNPSSRLKKIGASQKHHHGRPTSAPVVTPPTANRLDTSLSEPWSESFTVQLGRQMRTTCNFRLLRADPNDLLLSISPTNPSEKCCADGAAPDGTNRLSENALGERLSNALGIYSNDLNGLVLLVDKRLTTFRGVKRRLADACERSTEFHFPDLGHQLAEIRQTCYRITSEYPNRDMSQQRPIPLSQRNRISTHSPPKFLRRITSRPFLQLFSSFSLPTYTYTPTDTYAHALAHISDATVDQVEPIAGDVYITRHSNLTGGVIGGLAGGGGGISVVFHLVADSAIEREEDRIRSGAPLRCALSAILRTCFDYDITTLSLPLLLVQSVQEYMDAAWRARRAETVFKALKGVLMELSTWRGPTTLSLLHSVASLPHRFSNRSQLLYLPNTSVRTVRLDAPICRLVESFIPPIEPAY